MSGYFFYYLYLRKAHLFKNVDAGVNPQPRFTSFGGSLHLPIERLAQGNML
jgi:hypothetical protein